ncbi:hypothetical protein M9Y10_007582 [Tritrichomonas musculus]|uniref:Uncharacterized protein n=1 Tax=Tritrichomonas musculus TaxID=1915356 RepID=A0ABR2J1Y0_9EUKA
MAIGLALVIRLTKQIFHQIIIQIIRFFSQSIPDPSRYFDSPITDETSQIPCTNQLSDQPADVSHTISTIPNSSLATSKPIRLIDSEILLASGVHYNPVGPNNIKNPNWIIITAYIEMYSIKTTYT